MDEVKGSASCDLKISEDVIITVAKLAVLDVKGVAGLDGTVGKMSKFRNNGPIRVSMIEDVAALDIRIKVKSGTKAVTVAQEVQMAVKDSVQSMAGVPVARVNVKVSGIVF